MNQCVVALLVLAACGSSTSLDEDRSAITIDPVRVLADGRTRAEVIVTVRDADGVAQSGRAVELTVNDATLSPSTATSDEDGVVVATLVSVTGGTKSVTASSGGIELVAEAVFDAVPPPCTTEQRFPYPAPPPSGAIGVGDLNGDGIPDLLGVRGFNDNEETGALLGRGDGAFDKLPPVRVFGDEYVRRSVLVDLDNDGNLDFVNVGTFNGELLLHRGDGTGRFAQPANVDGGPFNIDFNNAPLAFGDFDDDEVIDVASIQASNVVTRRGNGDGTFQSPVATALAKPSVPISDMFAGDFNEDGRADLAIADPANATIHVAHANVDGTFGTPVSIVTTLSETDLRLRLKVVDIDGDGDADLFVRTTDSVVVIRSQGDETFASPASIAIPLTAEAEFLLPEVEIADIDRDGIPDLFASAGGHFLLLAGNGDGTFDAPSMIPGGDEAFAGGITVADFNVDGFPDVLTSVVLLYDGERFGPKVESLEVTDKLFGTAIVDLDRDGHPDVLSNVVVGTFLDVADEGALTSFRGRGDATFEAPLTNTSSRPVLRTSLLREGLGDFDRDGDPDLVTATATGIDIYLNDGGLEFSASIALGDALDRRAIVADFDGDHRLDILVATNFDSTVYVLLRGDGHGAFSEPVPAFDVDVTDTRLRTISTGDLDGDGNADLVLEGFNVFVIAKGRRGDTLQVFGSIDQFSERQGLADVDGDGILDLVSTGGDVPGSGVRASKGLGDGDFTPLSARSIDLGTTSPFQLVDIDRDGTIDSIHETGTIVHGVATAPTGVFQLAAQAIGDLDHDGMLDMVSEPRIGRQICAP